MKYNNKLDLIEYLQVVQEISEAFFDTATYEYVPHVGEIFAVCSYFNHCVEVEDSDKVKTKPIEDLLEAEKLYNDEDYMKHFWDEVYKNDTLTYPSLTFGRAYRQALDIVDYKKSDANSFANAITASIGAILSGFKNVFSGEDLEKLSKIANDITSGKLSNEAIVEAYEHSDRFKENTEKANSKAEANVIPFPQKK